MDWVQSVLDYHAQRRGHVTDRTVEAVSVAFAFFALAMFALAVMGVTGCVYAPRAERVDNRTILFSSRLVVADGTNTVHLAVEGGATGTATVPLAGK